MDPYRLLIIEDDKEIASLIAKVAQEAGFATRIACGIRDIYGAYEAFQPNLITLDIIMPEMDGLEVLQFLRERCARARIIILSGSEGLAHRLAEDLGGAVGLSIMANMYKPFRVTELRWQLDDAKLLIDSSRESHAKDVA